MCLPRKETTNRKVSATGRSHPEETVNEAGPRLWRVDARAAWPCLIIGAVLLWAAGAAFGQASPDDIAVPQEQGQTEGPTGDAGEEPTASDPPLYGRGFVPPKDWEVEARLDPCTPTRDLPEYFSWCDDGGCPYARSQGDCGGCWAFATIGPLECNIKIKDHISMNLSEQWLISCNQSGWDCVNGGQAAHAYHLTPGPNALYDPCGDNGAVLETDFPYVEWDAPCNCPYPHWYWIDNWAYICGSTPYIPGIKQAIMDYGPVGASVHAHSPDWDYYNGGIFNDCEAGGTNHMVVLVGWDDNQGTDGVWFLRNSWGTAWGEPPNGEWGSDCPGRGYMRIPFGCDSIGAYAHYIVYPGGIPLTIDLPDGVPRYIPPGVPSTITVEIEEGTEEYVPGTGTLYYRYDGGDWQTDLLEPLGGDLYEATLPPPLCESTPEYYFSAEGSYGAVVFNPEDAPTTTYSSGVGVLVPAFDDDFETDEGWTVQDSPGLTEGTWERNIPVWCDRGDPPSDYDAGGLGYCYLSEETYPDCNSDVDGGYSWLYSPIFDLSGGDGQVHFALWYTNDDGGNPDEDELKVHVSNDGGSNWTQARKVGPQSPPTEWFERTFFVGDYVTPTDQVQVRFEVSDLFSASIVEAGLDSFSLSVYQCLMPEACCLPDGTCVMMDPFDCLALGGAPQGPDSICTAPEACCLADGTCVDVDPLCCDDLGGVPQGEDTECTVPEACCLPDGTCVDADPLCCDDLGGVAQGAGTACTAPEACCLPDGTCTLADPLCCDELAGWLPGAPNCLGDANGNGMDDVCEPAGLKWVQVPDLAPTGIDVEATTLLPTILADDFACGESGGISEIRVWGSWYHNEYPFGDAGQVTFTLSFHTDDPEGPGGWSVPVDPPLWTRSFTPGQFSYEGIFDLDEGFYDPLNAVYEAHADQVCWLYTFPVPAGEEFEQEEGNVYWLDVQAYPLDDVSRFGWKTSLAHWNDDAVWAEGDEVAHGTWYELLYPAGHPLVGESIDLAFMLISGPDVRRPMAEDCATIAPGDRCSTSPTCTPGPEPDGCHEESHCVPAPTDEPYSPVCYAPKTRYVSIARHPEQVPDTARRVKLSDGMVLGWAGAPWEDPPDSGEWYANIVQAAHYETTWPSVVHVHCCPIAHANLCDLSGVHCRPNDCPGGETCVHHSYHIQAIAMGADPENEGSYSEVLELKTNTTWGDTVSVCPDNICRPPNGLPSLDDIMAAIAYFMGNKDVAPLVWLDIDPSNAEQCPDQIVGLGDIMAAIAGFQSTPYPGLGPTSCP